MIVTSFASQFINNNVKYNDKTMKNPITIVYTISARAQLRIN